MEQSTIEIFSDERFGEIRTLVMPDGQISFVGKDVAVALGYARSADAIRVHVAEDDKVVFKIPTLNGVRQMILVSESGLYSLALSSKLPKAREFKHWVTSDVLPKIRQTGAYMTRNTMELLMNDPRKVLALCHTLVAIDQKCKEAEDKAARLGREVDVLRPKADYVDSVLNSVDCLTTTQVAKELDMTAIELNRILCERGIQYGQSGQYLLYADFARLGYARNRTKLSSEPGGRVRTYSYLVWTEKGRRFIHRMMGK